jgi:mannitol-specific phosphotransferase system IIBC component
MIIHFLGGIHEIYFPYVLAHPIMILSVISGGLAADLWFTVMNAGLVATPSPGSIFAYLAVIPRGQHFAVLTGVLIGMLRLPPRWVWSFFASVPSGKRKQTKRWAAATAGVPGLA